MAEEKVLQVSLKEVKKEIDDLRASLTRLDKDSDEYSKTVDQIREQQSRLDEALSIGKKNSEALDGSYNALVKQMAQLRNEWKSTNDEAKRNELGQQIVEINDKLKEFDASIGNHQRNVGDYAIAGQSMKSTLRDLQQQMADMLANGISPTDEAFQELAQRAGNAKDALDDARNITKQFADDTKGLSATLDVAKTGVAAFGAVQGAMAAFGIENDKVGKAMVRLQGIMTMLNSLQTIQNALVDKGSATYRIFHSITSLFTKSKQSETVATNADTTAKATNATTASSAASAEQALAVSAGQSAAAMSEGAVSGEALAVAENNVAAGATKANTAISASKGALASSGWGALIVVIGMLIAKLMETYDLLKNKLPNAFYVASSYIDILREELEKTQEGFSIWGASQESIMNETIKSYDQIIEKYDEAVNALDSENEKYKEVLEERKKALKDFNKYASNAVWTLQKIYKENDEERKKQELGVYRYKKWIVQKEVDDQKQLAKTLLDVGQITATQYESLIQAIEERQKRLNADIDKEEAKEKERNKSFHQNLAKRTSATDKLTKAQQEAAKAAEKEVNTLKKLNSEEEKVIKNEKSLLEARGALSNTAAFNLDIKLIDKVVEGLEKEKKKYDELSKSTKLSENDRQKYAEKAADAEVSINDKKIEKQIIQEKNFTARLKKEYEDRLNGIEGKTSKVLSDIDHKLDSIEVGIIPVVGIDEEGLIEQMENMQHNVTDALGGSKVFDFEVLFDADETGMSGEEYERLLSDFEKFREKIYDENKTYGQELLGLTKSQESERYTIEALFAQERHSSLVEYYERTIEEHKNRLSQLTKDTEEYANVESEIQRLQMESEKETADFIIAQQDRVNKKRLADRQAHKKWVDDNINASIKFTESTSKLMGDIADIMEANIDQKVKNGEISEEMAKEEFERVKKVQLAELWISTLSGAAGAFLQDMKSYPAPFNYILAGIDFATAMTTGIAQHKKIKEQEYGGSSGGGSSANGGGISSVLVSPLLDETLDANQLTALNTEQMANNQQDNRVYILQSDISESNKQVEVRQQNTTF